MATTQRFTVKHNGNRTFYVWDTKHDRLECTFFTEHQAIDWALRLNLDPTIQAKFITD